MLLFSKTARGLHGEMHQAKPCSPKALRKAVCFICRPGLRWHVFRGPHSAYEVVPCERERYSFSPGHWSPFARTNFWQNRGEAGRTMAFELLTLLLLREPFVFTLAADEDDEPGERSHGPHNTVPRRTPYSGIDPR